MLHLLILPAKLRRVGAEPYSNAFAIFDIIRHHIEQGSSSIKYNRLGHLLVYTAPCKFQIPRQVAEIFSTTNTEARVQACLLTHGRVRR